MKTGKRAGEFFLFGLLSFGQFALAGAPCSSCDRDCCPAVQKIKIKKNVGIGSGEPPRYYSVASSRASVMTTIPAMRVVVDSGDFSSKSDRDDDLRDRSSNSRSDCASSSGDIQRLIAKMETLTDETSELTKIVDQLADRVIAMEKEVVEVKKSLPPKKD